MLDARELHVSIKGAEVLRGASLALPPKSFGALVGRNGAGKTSFMRAVMGLLPIDAGRVSTCGSVTTNWPAYRHAARGVGYMPEDRKLIPAWTVDQNIVLPGIATADRNLSRRLHDVYALIPELVSHKHRRALQLSGGQQKLVALGRAILAGQRLLLLDEPFEGVAPALAERLVEVLHQIRASSDCTVLITESEYVHSRNLADHVFEIERGSIRPD